MADIVDTAVKAGYSPTLQELSSDTFLTFHVAVNQLTPEMKQHPVIL